MKIEDLPRPAHYRRQMTPNGGYEMVPAYTAEEVLGILEAQWQPIETAPKDGRTLLLGYFNSAGKWRTLRGQWMSQNYIDEYWEDSEGVDPWWFETSVEADEVPNCWATEPTHWMPLPKAP